MDLRHVCEYMQAGGGARYKRAAAPELSFLDTQSQVQPRCPERPARVQVEQVRKLQAAEHLGEYNIWYGRYSGERTYERRGKASTRVVLELDAGLTRADYTNPNARICMHFARGCCIHGQECLYRHCAPTEDDETLTDAPHDIFGRNRHGTFKDDMGGTGNWNKECKTLYIGQICCTPSEPVLTSPPLGPAMRHSKQRWWCHWMRQCVAPLGHVGVLSLHTRCTCGSRRQRRTSYARFMSAAVLSPLVALRSANRALGPTCASCVGRLRGHAMSSRRRALLHSCSIPALVIAAAVRQFWCFCVVRSHACFTDN